MHPSRRPPAGRKPYVPALETDIRKTFRRIRREIEEQQEAEKHVRHASEKSSRSVA
jgi:hypothetical protein